MKNNLFNKFSATLAPLSRHCVSTLLTLLTLGVGQAWGDSGFFSTGQWKIGYNDGTNDTWKGFNDNGATIDLGTQTTLSLIGCNIKTWGYVKTNLDWWISYSSSLASADNGTGNYWSISADWNGDHEWYMDNNDYDMIANAPNNPGENTLYMVWSLRNYNTSTGQAKVKFTIPGFKSLSTTSITFDNTAVGSTNDKSITYTHYGTAPTNVAARYSITGTDANQFSITALSGTGATIRFTPTSAGSKTATLVINDTHGKKTAEITLTGKTLHTLSFNANGHGTAPGSQNVAYGATGTKPTDPEATGWTFMGWYKESGCTTAWNWSSDVVNENTILYAKWQAESTYSIAVVAGTGIESVSLTPVGSANKDNIKANDQFTINATVSTGYSWSTWTKSGSGTLSTFSDATQSQTVQVGTAGNITLTASATEVMSSLTTSNHYDAGNPSYTAPTKGASSIGVTTTTTTITAASPGTGYTFAGWTLSDNIVVTSGNKETDKTLTIRTNGNGAAATAQAKYTEDLSTTWYLEGADPPFGGWSAVDGTMMKKATGSSTASVAYKTITVTSVGTYEFKLYKSDGAYTESCDQRWYGYGSDNNYLTWDATGTKTIYNSDCGSNPNGNNLKFEPNIAGDYDFKIDYSGTYPSVTVTFPVSYTLTYGMGTIMGANGSISTSPTVTSGGKVLDGKSVKLTAPAAATGYTWKGWYTDAAGTTGKINDTNRAITVTMNENKTLYACYDLINYNITYNLNGGSGASNSTYTVTTNTITLPTAPTVNKTGYTFGGWFLASDFSGTSQTQITKGSTGAKTYYAKWDIIWYNIAYELNGGSKEGIVPWNPDTYNIEQNVNIDVAPTKEGYDFAGWYTDETLTTAISSPAISVGATGDKTFYAKWTAKSYTVTLDVDEENKGTISGATTSQNVTYDAATVTISVLPTAANGYAFMGFFTEANGNGKQVIDADGSWKASVDGYTDASTHWIHDGDVTLYAYYRKAVITGLKFEATAVAPGGEVGVTPVIEPTPTGTTVICWKLLYNNDNEYDPQPTFSANSSGVGSKVTFTAPSASGTYKVQATLRTGSSCGGGTELSTQVVSFQVAGDHEVTVLYKCGDVTIKASETVTGKPLEWRTITAPNDIFGYTFSKWKAGDGITIDGADANGEKTDATIQFRAIYDGKLTAEYTQKNIIYFKNTLDWSDVYVNLMSASYWDDSKGSGNGNNYYSRNNQMSLVDGTTDIYYYEYDCSTSAYVSFTSSSQDDSNNFWASGTGVNVVYPTRPIKNGTIEDDFPNDFGFYAKTPMFVPLAGQTAKVMNNENSNGKANYYNNGYWTKYTAGTGYVLKIYNSGGNDLLKSIDFTSADELMGMSAVADLEANTTYKYEIMREGDVYYGNDQTMNYSNHGQGTPWEMTWKDGGHKAGLTTTASGDYTFTLTYSENASHEYRLRIAVDYPIADGDYRVIYKDGVHTAYKPSAIVPKVNDGKDTVSFFIRPKNGSKSLKIQQATVATDGAITWGNDQDITSAITDAKCPQDSVYNICLTMDASGNISVENVEAYTGNFYIRTDAANNKWDNYKNSDHVMTYSEYSEKNSDFTHYWVKFVSKGANVKFVVANDYSPCISDTLIQQNYRGGDNTHVDANGFLNNNLDGDGVNIRYMWHKQTNVVTRAYLAPAQQDGSKFLVLRGQADKLLSESGEALTSGNNHGAPDNSIQFSDDENWIYEATVQVVPSSYVKLYAHFNNSDFYYRGNSGEDFEGTAADGTPNAVQLVTGEGTEPVTVRVIYDFKTDRLIAALLPSGNIEKETPINADVMFIREHQEDIAQLTFTGTGKITEIKTAYVVMRFNKWTLNNKDKNTKQPLTSPLSRYERDLYYVSFPFDVNLNEVFGFGTYGVHWIMEYYDGEARAKNGFWKDSPTYWKFITNRNGYVLKKNVGYILALDLDEMGEGASVWGVSENERAELFFPSSGTMPNITSGEVTATLDKYECTINRNGSDRTKADSHWNIMGVPTYVNVNDPEFANDTWKTAFGGPKFLYTWNSSDNTLTPTSATGFTYHAMHAYTVQYYGDVTWKTSVSPSSIVARQKQEPSEYEWCLELQQNDQMTDRTYVRMSDEDEVTSDFEFGYDMSKSMEWNKANIYTFIGTETVAGNSIPLEREQTTTIPLGVYINADGDYTFAMPAGTSGVGVTLVDTEANVRTSLSALSYTVHLTAGTYDSRFMLEISPVKGVSTDIQDTGDGMNGTSRKVLIDGILYIVRDGKIYDARGALVR